VAHGRQERGWLNGYGRQLLRRIDDLPDPSLLLALLTLRNQIVAALPA
jgi:hypothetical protein